MTWQYIGVGVVVVAAIIYASYVIWRSLSQRNDPCHDCKGCALHSQMMNNRNRKLSEHCPNKT